MIKIGEINRNNDPKWLAHVEFEQYLDRNYESMLARLCGQLEAKTKGTSNRNYALAKCIQEYFDKKTYDYNYYNAQKKKELNFYKQPRAGFNEFYDVFKEYKYSDEKGQQKIGYHTPNSKKVILWGKGQTVICQGCAELVVDIINYCNSKYGFNIICEQVENDYHAWNRLTIDGKTYDYDMSKCYHNGETYSEVPKPVTLKASEVPKPVTLKAINYADGFSIKYNTDNISSRSR